jgi:hypothetical protein
MAPGSFIEQGSLREAAASDPEPRRGSGALWRKVPVAFRIAHVGRADLIR